MGLIQNFGVALLAGVPGALMTIVGVGYLWTYFRLTNSDPVELRSLGNPDREVELAGTAEPHEETTRTPFTDTESLVYDWKVQEYTIGGPGKGKSWSPRDSGSASHPFVLDDGTGRALIQAHGSSPHLQETTSIVVEKDETPPAQIAEYLETADGVENDSEYSRRFVEKRLDPGDDVHVLGPILESGSSFDLPGGVDAVVGVENPHERGFTVGEDDLSDLREQIGSDTVQFIVSNADEVEAEKHLRSMGLVWSIMGLVFVGIAVWALFSGVSATLGTYLGGPFFFN